MKTTISLLLLTLSACSTTPRPVAAIPSVPVPVAVRDTAGTAYEESQKRLIAEWEWYGGR